jgi:hypothetical protein
MVHSNNTNLKLFGLATLHLLLQNTLKRGDNTGPALLAISLNHNSTSSSVNGAEWQPYTSNFIFADL